MSTASTVRPRGTLRYCGRDFTPDELETIRRIADDPHQPTRTEIARAVCAALDWRKADGALKVMSCTVALHRMEAHGVIWLPLPHPRTHRSTPSRLDFRHRPGASTALHVAGTGAGTPGTGSGTGGRRSVE